MTLNRFNYIKQNFDKFEGKKIEYTYYIPSADMYKTTQGILLEVGTEANAGCLIVQSGYGMASVYYGNIRKIFNN